jgi:hypothetical protein
LPLLFRITWRQFYKGLPRGATRLAQQWTVCGKAV